MPRSPKPTRELVLTGAFRADRHGNRVDASLPACRLAAPPWLGEPSKAIFDELASDLADITAEVDCSALALLADAMADYRAARATVQSEGAVIDGSKGKIAHPAVRIMRDAWQRAMAMGRQFGLTPVSRATLRVPPKPEAENDKARFFRQ